MQEIIRYGDAEIGGLASTLLGERRKVRKKEADRWGLREILAGETWDEPPSDAMARMHGNGYIPGLTMKMKIRLMGLPEGYRLVGSKVSQSQQVGNAVVPRMAQAVGLAIYSALRGVEFEWEIMLREPRLFYEASARIELSPPGLDDIDTSPEEICATA
ncbi:DNA cytosine methyltransferase [Rhizobium sp.]|uniref:DNA cytosine methyltransferase n=1 Tax=Rhizobium sp. TaxID=391 RepID=UPI0028A5E903